METNYPHRILSLEEVAALNKQGEVVKLTEAEAGDLEKMGPAERGEWLANLSPAERRARAFGPTWRPRPS